MYESEYCAIYRTEDENVNVEWSGVTIKDKVEKINIHIRDSGFNNKKNERE